MRRRRDQPDGGEARVDAGHQRSKRPVVEVLVDRLGEVFLVRIQTRNELDGAVIVREHVDLVREEAALLVVFGGHAWAKCRRDPWGAIGLDRSAIRFGEEVVFVEAVAAEILHIDAGAFPDHFQGGVVGAGQLCQAGRVRAEGVIVVDGRVAGQVADLGH